ncbi:adenylyl-sulfate kinase [Pseudodesulfovibrio sp. JC047]|uniref:adenylyl-sulfate kinase n=1 Tax=Pseudodesulfovibrio sp. JC047 TaxID=2683199 RepID=UPI0013D0BAB4|nr:adenylyl-sulfate kinase [Pseudodesulfovibrio sp. JC047]NDV20184.1 adenylyl-sulfate kinase [Pseudodesulfovibrio sp. JC047]
MVGQGNGWAIWIVGLPGSGKSTVAHGVHDVLTGRGIAAELLQMDARRRTYFPRPTYSVEEREKAYSLFVDEAVRYVRRGQNVVMDGAAYQRSMRASARQQIDRFAEIFIQCSLDEAIRREAARPDGMVMAGLYAKALHRKRTGEPCAGLGDVIGVDVAFEKDQNAEFIIDNTLLSPEETLRKVLHFLDTWIPNA